jgi:predicted GNAT family acetyltransferase
LPPKNSAATNLGAFKGDTLIFKADVISETNDVIYLEGIWVREEARNDGTGRRCMAELSRRL